MGKDLTFLFLLLFVIAPCTMVAGYPPEDFWASKTPMRVARTGLGVATVNGKIYAIGGFNGTYLNLNEEYNPATNTWTSRSPMPTARAGFGIAVYQNKIYVMGGASGQLDITGFNEVYDPATDTWERKTPIPTPRQGFKANVVDGKIYTIGGFRYVEQTGGISIQDFSLNEVYDPATYAWMTKAPLPVAVYGYESAVVNDRIYIIAGSGTNLNQIYDPANDTWSEGAPIPNVLDYGAGAATTGITAPKRIYVLGGGAIINSNLNSVYDPELDVWSTGASMPTPHSEFGVAVLDDVLYAIGGSGQQVGWYTGANEQYFPIGYGTEPPIVSVLSPEKLTYNASSVPLVFTVNEQTSWMAYNLDGQANFTVSGNATLSGLLNGPHCLTVYANDTFNHMTASETIDFSVEVPEPFPVMLVTVVAVTIVAVAGCLLAYFRRRKH